MKCATCGTPLKYRELDPVTSSGAPRVMGLLPTCTCKEHGNARRCVKCCKAKDGK